MDKVTEWNASQYLMFAEQRNQPIRDLLDRIRTLQPRTIVDLGCGPGNSTSFLQQVFPEADILGIDSSEAMIDRARASYSELGFEVRDVRSLEGTYDLIFSNACLQWIPDHSQTIPEMFTHLAPGGTFAAQFPMNTQEPLFQIIDDVAQDPRWHFDDTPKAFQGTLTPAEYFDLFASCSDGFQIWETRYYHNLPDHQALLDWVKGARLRPYLARLPEDQRGLFEEEILCRAQETYPRMKNGEVILRFNRFFVIATCK